MHASIGQTLLELIEDSAVSDQATLLGLLAARGHRLTQPTLSRHLKKLSVMKVGGQYRRVERTINDRPPFAVIESPPNLLILKTAPGHAPLLGVRVDQIGIEEIAGSLAGDDTLFIALAAGADIGAVHDRIKGELDG